VCTNGILLLLFFPPSCVGVSPSRGAFRFSFWYALSLFPTSPAHLRVRACCSFLVRYLGSPRPLSLAARLRALGVDALVTVSLHVLRIGGCLHRSFGVPCSPRLVGIPFPTTLRSSPAQIRAGVDAFSPTPSLSLVVPEARLVDCGRCFFVPFCRGDDARPYAEYLG
jgi:hypothetical protein